jgi:hypothetical protein
MSLLLRIIIIYFIINYNIVINYKKNACFGTIQAGRLSREIL